MKKTAIVLMGIVMVFSGLTCAAENLPAYFPFKHRFPQDLNRQSF